MTEPTISETILERVKTNALAAFLGDRFGWLEDAAFDAAVAACVELHNSGQIDLVGLVHTEEFKALDLSDFFFAQHVFVEAIPSLISPVDEMLSCVDALVARAGEDGAANLPLGPLATWIKADTARAREVVEKAEAGREPAIAHYSQGLIGCSDITHARNSAEAFTGKLQLAAVHALGELAHDAPETHSTFALILDLEAKHPGDDPLRAALITACVRLAEKQPTTLEAARAVCLSLVAAAGPHTIHFCARAIWLQPIVQNDKALAQILLSPLMQVPPSNKGTVREIDYGLNNLMKAGSEDTAIEFVTTLLGAADCELSLDELKMFSIALEKSSKFPATLVAWLRTGAPALCRGLVSLLSGDSLSGQVIILPEEVVAITPDEQIFVCRKAVGYFFLQPVTAASIVTSFLRHATEESRDQITGLLFMPLLQNYGGDVLDYLEGIQDTDAASPSVKEVLAANREYLDGVSKVGELRELAPSEHQRLIEHMRQRDEAAQTFRIAREQSVLLQFIKRSTLLHGRSSLSYVDVGDGQQAHEMELTPHSVKMELPRMSIVDPVGLDYLLLRLRNEELIA